MGGLITAIVATKLSNPSSSSSSSCSSKQVKSDFKGMILVAPLLTLSMPNALKKLMLKGLIFFRPYSRIHIPKQENTMWTDSRLVELHEQSPFAPPLDERDP